jgi:hypothetical protein
MKMTFKFGEDRFLPQEKFDGADFTNISNSRFKKVYTSGTGNSTCPVPKAEQIRLQNHLIDDSVVGQVLDLLYDMGEDIISVELSHRRTTQRWGTAWPRDRRVILYRHTAWCFLHEVAHILNHWDAQADADKANAPYFQYKRKSHGREFGKYQQMLYDLWMEHIEPQWADLYDKAALNAPEEKVDPVKAEFEAAFIAGKFGMMVSAETDGNGNVVNYIDNTGIITDYGVWVNSLKFTGGVRPSALPHRPATPPRRKRPLANPAREKFQRGDKVWFWNGKRKQFKITGTVKNINLKTIRITDTSDGVDWRVSPNLLNKV